MSRIRAQARSASPTFEPLERRQMLSASVSDGELNVTGTSGDDHIAIWAQHGTGWKYVVDINGQRSSFPLRSAGTIQVRSGAGNDRIDLGLPGGHIAARVTVRPGPGNDVVNRPSSSPAARKSKNAFAPAADSVAPTLIPPAASLVVKPETPFLAFDGINLPGKPSLETQGLPRICIAYASDLLRLAPDGNWDYSAVDEQLARNMADRAAALGQMLLLDIEWWQTDARFAGEQQAEINIAKMIQVIDWVKDEQPQLKVSIYDGVPADYGLAIRRGGTAAAFAELAHANAMLQPLAEKLDYIAPVFYSFDTDMNAWYVNARARMQYARTYNKPIYPLLLPYYAFNGQAMPPSVWRFQLETVRQFADGSVIWTSHVPAWDSRLPWWNITSEVVQDTSSLPASPASTRTTSGRGSISVAWTGDTRAAGYIIERSNDGVNFQQMVALPADHSIWTDRTARGKCCYRVYAFNGLGASDYSKTVSASPL